MIALAVFPPLHQPGYRVPSPVYVLYHHPLDPPSRRVRLALAEKGVACDFIIEKPWKPGAELLEFSPSGDVPVLIVEEEGDRRVLADAQAICEYLDETQAAAPACLARILSCAPKCGG